MTLMARPRRALGILMLAAMAIPALSMPFQKPQTYSATENRLLSAKPGWPEGVGAWTTWPRQVDSYLRDHFGFREPLLDLGNRVFVQAPPAAGALPPVIDGENGRLFLVEGLLSSTGREIDRAAAEDFAEYACDMARRVQRDGAKLILSIPPSPGEIYPEDAPRVALPVRGPTNYDLIATAARACGVTVADLRPALRAAKSEGQLYRRTDTHWTPLGALVGFNRLAEAMGRPDLAIPLDHVGWIRQVHVDGDLPRMAGRPPIRETVMEPDSLRLPKGAQIAQLPELRTGQRGAPMSITTRAPGPTVLIVGDSFTQWYFPPYFSHGVRRVVWVHGDNCRFDWRILRSVQPDFVLLMPTERYAVCSGRGRPTNYAAPP